MIFGSRCGLDALLESDTVLSDGTFDFVHRLFQQLYTIHGRVSH